MYISEVAPESAAAAAGLQPGDIILGAGRRAVATPADLEKLVQAWPAGRPLLLRVARDNGILFLAVG